MASEVEITAPVSTFRDRLGARDVTPYTAYPQLQTIVSADRKKDENEKSESEILPYMARAHSPVRVKFTPSTLNKTKSRVADTARSAIFNYKPTKRKDNLAPLRFRAPDATSTTDLRKYLSPWVSVTKTDYKDPRFNDNDSTDCCSLKAAADALFPPRYYVESVTELMEQDSLPESQTRTETPARSETVSRDISRIPSSKTVSTEKRVKIIEPSEMTEFSQVKKPPSRMNASSKLMNIKEPDSGVNYYSGYLPPEYSEKIAETLHIGEKVEASENEPVDTCRIDLSSQFYKPLVGDRTIFKRGTYPAPPKLALSDIYQIRLEDRKRLLKSNGQAPVHFSALKNRGTLATPKQRGVHLDEAVRTQQRQTSSAHALSRPSRVPAKSTSIEQFQLQRERTYHLQSLAREMINK